MTGDQPPPLSRFEFAAAELRGLGITVMRLPGKYRVNYRTGTDAPAPPGRTEGYRRRRPRRMTPKAIRRRMIRAHNRRMRARALQKKRAPKAPNRIPETTCDDRRLSSLDGNRLLSHAFM
jgi:hypothetical protein